MKQGSQILRALGQNGQNYLTEQFITYVNPISSFKIDDPLTNLRCVVSGGEGDLIGKLFVCYKLLGQEKRWVIS